MISFIIHSQSSCRWSKFKFNDTWCWLRARRGSSWWLSHETAENLHAGNMGSGMLWAECATQTPKRCTEYSGWWNKNFKRSNRKERRNNIKNNFMLYASMIWMHNVCFINFIYFSFWVAIQKTSRAFVFFAICFVPKVKEIILLSFFFSFYNSLDSDRRRFKGEQIG